MNMQHIQEHRKAQAKANKINTARFMAALHLLTVQHGIEIFAKDGFMLIESEAHDQEYLTVWADGVHYRGRDGGYVAKSIHPDFMPSEDSNE